VIVFCVAPSGIFPPTHIPTDGTACPGDPTKNLLRVDFGRDYGAEASWRATPGVLFLPESFNWGTMTVPLAAVPLFGSWGVLATDTMAQAAHKIRAAWPHFDPH
jgi:hypothetical protein